MSNPVTNKQGMPRLDTPLVNPLTGLVADPWWQFFIYLWRKVGAGGSSPATTVNFQYSDTSTGLPIQAFDPSGTLLGDVVMENANPGNPIGVSPGGSPFIYSPAMPGTLVVFGAQVEIGRNGGFIMASLVGGAIPLALNDSARMTWFSADPPTITWLPST